MPTNSRKSTATERIEIAPVAQRKGIKISARTRELYEERNRALDDDPDARPLPPDQWASALRRDEFFRPIKKQTTVRLDADVLDWLKSKGEGHGHITRVNEILRSAMLADLRRRSEQTSPKAKYQLRKEPVLGTAESKGLNKLPGFAPTIPSYYKPGQPASEKRTTKKTG